jgi:hypothetical protein
MAGISPHVSVVRASIQPGDDSKPLQEHLRASSKVLRAGASASIAIVAMNGDEASEIIVRRDFTNDVYMVEVDDETVHGVTGMRVNPLTGQFELAKGDVVVKTCGLPVCISDELQRGDEILATDGMDRDTAIHDKLTQPGDRVMLTTAYGEHVVLGRTSGKDGRDYVVQLPGTPPLRVFELAVAELPRR